MSDKTENAVNCQMEMLTVVSQLSKQILVRNLIEIDQILFGSHSEKNCVTLMLRGGEIFG